MSEDLCPKMESCEYLHIQAKGEHMSEHEATSYLTNICEKDFYECSEYKPMDERK